MVIIPINIGVIQIPHDLPPRLILGAFLISTNILQIIFVNHPQGLQQQPAFSSSTSFRTISGVWDTIHVSWEILCHPSILMLARVSFVF